MSCLFLLANIELDETSDKDAKDLPFGLGALKARRLEQLVRWLPSPIPVL